MKNVKKLLALLLTLAMLVSVPVVAFAEETAVPLFPNEVKNSITAEEITGNGLAFLFEMNIRGAAVNAYNEFVNTDAVATVDGTDYAVVSMGAVLANRAVDVANIDNLTREDKNEDGTILDVPARYLWDVTDSTCSFAVRIIRLPEKARGIAIAARPYVVLEKDGEQITLYGQSDMATYHQVYYTNVPEETPVLDTLAVTNIKNENVSAAFASAVYEAICPITYKEGFKVTLTLTNSSANAKSSAGDSLTYTCYDAEGNELGSAVVDVDVLTAGATKDAEIYVPVGTASIVATDKNLNYVPDIILPAIGSDIDVTKKKNRIRVSAASASFNEDGTIHVSLTFHNYTTTWITEETDYVRYGYYKGTTRKGLDYIYIGVIDTRKHPTKTFEFDVPNYTTEVRFVSSKIVYWTEWS